MGKLPLPCLTARGPILIAEHSIQCFTHLPRGVSLFIECLAAWERPKWFGSNLRNTSKYDICGSQGAVSTQYIYIYNIYNIYIYIPITNLHSFSIPVVLSTFATHLGQVHGEIPRFLTNAPPPCGCASLQSSIRSVWRWCPDPPALISCGQSPGDL